MGELNFFRFFSQKFFFFRKFFGFESYHMTNCIFSGERDVMMKQLREQVSEKENEVHRLGKFPSNLAII